MTEQGSWYARPVFCVTDVNRAASFYIDKLGFWKKWHQDTVCQVNRGDVEIILAEETERRDKARIFVELNDAQREELRLLIAERSVPSSKTWWGYDCIQVDDPDGNSLLFAMEG
jgi:hypothetical protein